VGVPVTHWSAHLLGGHLRAQEMAVSDRSVSRILHDADLKPHRQRMWLTSQDDEFRAKRDDVLRVYYDSPPNEHIVCVDEKTGMQALERRCADTPMAPGQPARREFEYKRHGTLCWMGAFDVRRGKPFGFTSHDHDSDTFIDLLDIIDTVYPSGRGHIIMDNLSAHDTSEVNEWFDEHPRWTRHFTPKHASWLNQIECWFSILGRHVLARGSFTSPDDLAAKIDAYVEWYLKTDQPFQWSYRPKSWRMDGQTSGERD
jgi:transposase